MPVSDARKRANAKWNAANIATLGCKVRNEQADIFKGLCESAGKAPNSAIKAYVMACIESGHLIEFPQPDTASTQE